MTAGHSIAGALGCITHLGVLFFVLTRTGRQPSESGTLPYSAAVMGCEVTMFLSVGVICSSSSIHTQGREAICRDSKTSWNTAGSVDGHALALSSAAPLLIALSSR